MQLLELIRTRAGDPEVVTLAAPALAAVLRTWPSQTAATFAKVGLLDLLAAAIEQQRRMHVDQVLSLGGQGAGRLSDQGMHTYHQPQPRLLTSLGLTTGIWPPETVGIIGAVIWVCNSGAASERPCNLHTNPECSRNSPSFDTGLA